MRDNSQERCGICATIAQIGRGKSPDLIVELSRSYVILGDAQFYRGYCLLLAKHHAREPFLMPRDGALALFNEVCSVAEAVAEVTRPLKINYECLGNVEAHVHWHVFPRYETDDLVRAPVWARPESERRLALNDHDRTAIMAAVREQICRRIPDARRPGD